MIFTVKYQICFLLLFILAGTVSAQSQNTASGPIPVRNSRPYNLLFLQFRPESPDVLSRGKSSWNIQVDLINNMLRPATANGISLVEDNEYDRLSLHYAKGIGRGWEMTASSSLLFRNGGILDDLMNAWHRFFGINPSQDDPVGRQNLPSFKSQLFLTDPFGKAVLNQGNGFGLGETTLGLKRQFASTSRSAMSIRTAIKLPTGNPSLVLGSGRPDIGLSFDIRYNLGRELIVYANIGGVWTGGAPKVPHAIRLLSQVLLAVEYQPNSHDSFILQSDGSGAAVSTGNPFVDRANITSTFGYWRRLSATSSAYLSFSENGDYHNFTIPQIGNIGPDFTATLGFQFRR